MSATGDEWADAAMRAIRRGTAVAKSAGGPSGDEVTEAVVRSLCDTFARHYDDIREHLEYMRPVLEAIAAPPPGPQGWMPFLPDQWHANRLVPKLPERTMNGASE